MAVKKTPLTLPPLGLAEITRALTTKATAKDSASTVEYRVLLKKSPRTFFEAKTRLEVMWAAQEKAAWEARTARLERSRRREPESVSEVVEGDEGTARVLAAIEELERLGREMQ